MFADGPNYNEATVELLLTEKLPRLSVCLAAPASMPAMDHRCAGARLSLAFA